MTKSYRSGTNIAYIEYSFMLLIQRYRQRRNFFYLCGCALPDCYLTYEIENDRLTLYIPPIDPDSVIWSGLPLFPKEAMELYDVDSVLLNTEIVTYLNHYCDTCENPSRLFAIDGRTSPDVALLPFDEIDFNYLKRAIENCRVTKDSHEIALMQRANDVSSQAHIGVWKSVNSTSNEMHLEATHISACLSSGCKTQAYHPIVASGTNSATLHYTKNNQDLTGRLNVLVDAAGEYNTYCADITRTFPISGKFSPETRSVYDIVMKMQLVSISMIHSGASWEAIHANAHRIAINGLLTLGILKGKESEIFDKGVSVAFFPHGLGHYIGMDTHDVGGHPNYSDPNPMFRYLRVRGKLPVNSVITVEPGVSLFY